MNRNSLEDAVFAVFEHACRDRDFEVAEHLLRALEAIAHRSDSDEQLEAAYLRLAENALQHRRLH